MRIAVVGGTGKEGSGLALRWAKAGHEVLIGSRDEAKGSRRARELGGGLEGGSLEGGGNAWAAARAEVSVVTVPYAAHGATLEAIREAAAGKVVVDVTVPLRPPKIREVHLPESGSAAVEAQRILGGDVRVVAALHHVSSALLADTERSIDCDVLVCSDDEGARDLALRLVGDLGLRGLDAGPLANSVALESLTPVLLHVNRRYGGPGVGIRITGLSGE